MEIVCLSANVRQCNIAFMYKFVFIKSFLSVCYYYISLLPTRVAANTIKRICASGWFVRMQIKTTTSHTVLTVMLDPVWTRLFRGCQKN